MRDAKFSLSDTLLMEIFNNGFESALQEYDDILSNKAEEFDLREKELNNLGYMLMQSKLVKEAITIFGLNVKAYPESFNVYDSLGEAYLMDEQNDAALKNYKKSLALNPNPDKPEKPSNKKQITKLVPIILSG